MNHELVPLCGEASIQKMANAGRIRCAELDDNPAKLVFPIRLTHEGVKCRERVVAYYCRLYFLLKVTLNICMFVAFEEFQTKSLKTFFLVE